MKKKLLLLPLLLLGAQTTSSLASPIKLVQPQAELSSERTIRQKQEFNNVKVGDVISLSDYVEVIPGSDESLLEQGDRTFTFSIYSDERGATIERYKDIHKVNMDSDKVVCIAPGVANVEVKSKDAKLMLSFYVHKSDTLEKATNILDKVGENFTLTQQRIADDGTVISESSIYRTADYYYSEIDNSGILFTSDASYRLKLASLDGGKDDVSVFARPEGETKAEYFNSAIDPSNLDFRLFSYQSEMVQSDAFPFEYAYLPLVTTDSYLRSVLRTFTMPYYFTGYLNNGTSAQLNVVGLGLDADDDNLYFYPICENNSSIYIMNPFILNADTIGNTEVASVDNFLASEPTYPTAVTAEEITTLWTAIGGPEQKDDGYNYTMESSAEFLDVDRKTVLQSKPEGISANFLAFSDHLRKVTERGIYFNYFNDIVASSPSAEGGYYMEQRTDETDGSLDTYNVTYHLDENGAVVKDSEAKNLRASNYITSVSGLSVYNPYQNFYLYLQNAHQGSIQYEDGNHYFCIGETPETGVSYNGNFIRAFLLFATYNTYSSGSVSTLINNAGKNENASIDLVIKDDSSVSLEIYLPLLNSGEILGYYHVTGKVYDVGTTTIPELDAVLNPSSDSEEGGDLQ